MGPFLDAKFFDFLKIQLALAIGPVAEYIIKDELGKFGGDFARVPRDRAAEMVDLLARQIRRPEKKIAFVKAMIEKLKEDAAG